MAKHIQRFAWALIITGSLVITYFIIKAFNDGYRIGFGSTTNYEISGQFGDFVGGLVGTLFALSGTLLIFLSFWEQNKQNIRESFEARYFEMIRLHRENVSELRYNKSDKKKEHEYENRQVISVIFQEFIECYRDVKKFSNSVDPDYYIKKEYQDFLRKIVTPINPQINIIELAIIDIAFKIIFFGLGTEGLSVLRNDFGTKYNSHYYYRLLYYVKLKPKRENKKRFRNWQELMGYELSKLHPLIEEIYKVRSTPGKTELLSEFAKSLKLDKSYEKYYGGHQFRLGHYFRHLFQSFKYVDAATDVTPEEKYVYAKMLRAQLSTYEQALLFFNSLSTLGMTWEYIADTDKKSNVIKNLNLISTYHLIKNLPGDNIYGIKYKTYYKKVNFESGEQIV